MTVMVMSMMVVVVSMMSVVVAMVMMTMVVVMMAVVVVTMMMAVMMAVMMVTMVMMMMAVMVMMTVMIMMAMMMVTMMMVSMMMVVMTMMMMTMMVMMAMMMMRVVVMVAMVMMMMTMMMMAVMMMVVTMVMCPSLRADRDVVGNVIVVIGVVFQFLVVFDVCAFIQMIGIWMHDPMSIIGHDEDHLSVGEELVQVLGGHLELRNELNHLLGDVLGGGGELDHGHVFAFFVAEGGVPQFVDGLVVGLEGLFGILFLASQVHVSLSDDLLEVDVLLDEGLHGGVELLDLGVVLRRLRQRDDRLGQFGGMLSDVARDGGRGQGGGGDGAEKDAN